MLNNNSSLSIKCPTTYAIPQTKQPKSFAFPKACKINALMSKHIESGKYTKIFKPKPKITFADAHKSLFYCVVCFCCQQYVCVVWIWAHGLRRTNRGWMFNLLSMFFHIYTVDTFSSGNAVGHLRSQEDLTGKSFIGICFGLVCI